MNQVFRHVRLSCASTPSRPVCSTPRLHSAPHGSPSCSSGMSKLLPFLPMSWMGEEGQREGTLPARSHTAGSRENQGLSLCPAPPSVQRGPLSVVLPDHLSSGSHGRVSCFALGRAESRLEPGSPAQGSGYRKGSHSSSPAVYPPCLPRGWIYAKSPALMSKGLDEGQGKAPTYSGIIFSHFNDEESCGQEENNLPHVTVNK